MRQDCEIWLGRSVTKGDGAIFGMCRSESTEKAPRVPLRGTRWKREEKKKSILAGFSERGVWELF